MKEGTYVTQSKSGRKMPFDENKRVHESQGKTRAPRIFHVTVSQCFFTGRENGIQTVFRLCVLCCIRTRDVLTRSFRHIFVCVNLQTIFSCRLSYRMIRDRVNVYSDTDTGLVPDGTRHMDNQQFQRELCWLIGKIDTVFWHTRNNLCPYRYGRRRLIKFRWFLWPNISP